MHAEVDVERGDVERDHVEAVGPRGDQRRAFVDRLENGHVGWHLRRDHLDRRSEFDLGLVTVGRRRDRPLHQRDRVGWITEGEAMTRRFSRRDAIDAPRAPLGQPGVAGHEVPPTPDAHDAIRMEPAFGRAVVAVAIVHRQLVRPTACGADGTQDGAVDVVDGRLRRDHRCGQRHVVTQLRRQHLLQLRDGSLCGVAEALSARGANEDRQRERLVGVEHQRGHRRPADAEPVTAARARLRIDLVPELTQPIDIAAHRSHGDVQPSGQLRARPRRP